MAAETHPDCLITEKQAARMLSVSHRTMQAWRRIGFGPRFCKLGRSVRYRRSDVMGWADQNQHVAAVAAR